ncbi:MAG: GNAT family N-acetyltransferase [Candidatus Enterenecus sp.]
MQAPIDVTSIQIETERLILRPWRQSDLEDFYAYASVEGVGEMAGWVHHRNREETQAILDSFIAHKKTFALELKETGQVIGSLGIEEYDDRVLDEPDLYGRELGYVLSKEYWGRGLMTEAVKAVIGYCFHTLHYDFLTCGHFVRNDRSRRVIEKSGFRHAADGVYETRYGTQEPERLYVIYNPELER